MLSSQLHKLDIIWQPIGSKWQLSLVRKNCARNKIEINRYCTWRRGVHSQKETWCHAP